MRKRPRLRSIRSFHWRKRKCAAWETNQSRDMHSSDFELRDRMKEVDKNMSLLYYIRHLKGFNI